MIVKSFTADSVAAALKDVRSELGGDAMVLSTRQLTDSGNIGKVEITACLDGPVSSEKSVSLPVVDRADIILDAATTIAEETLVEDQVEATPPGADVSQPAGDSAEVVQRLGAIETELRALGDIGSIYQKSRQMPQTLRAVRASLHSADIPEFDITEICRFALSGSTHLSNIPKVVRAELKRRLESYVVADEFTLSPGQSALFIGPPGAGKTTVMGKLAARLIVREQAKVRFISLGATKVGAVDELQSFSEILGGEFLPPGDVNQFVSAPDAVSLLDSPALSSVPAPDSELLMTVNQIQPTYRVIVFSALTRSADLSLLLKTVNPFSPTHLVITMTDLTDCWGTALALCKRTGAKLALVNDAPSGIGSLSSPDVNQILDKLLGESESEHV